MLVLLFLWLTNPVASHFVARAEVATNGRVHETCDVLDIVELGAPPESSRAPDAPLKARD